MQLSLSRVEVAVNTADVIYYPLEGATTPHAVLHYIITSKRHVVPIFPLLKRHVRVTPRRCRREQFRTNVVPDCSSVEVAIVLLPPSEVLPGCLVIKEESLVSVEAFCEFSLVIELANLHPARVAWSIKCHHIEHVRVRREVLWGNCVEESDTLVCVWQTWLRNEL